MFDYKTKFKGKTIKYRKWKVRDKKRFLDVIENNLNPNLIIESLVYDCIENKDIALSPEEYKYLLFQIRKESISNIIEYEFQCDTCEKDYTYKLSISDVFKPVFNGYGELKYKDTKFKMGEVRNKQYYTKTLSEADDQEMKDLVDFIFHVEELNESDAFTFDEVYDFIDNMDIETAENIFNQWEKMKFHVTDTVTAICEHCGATELLEFDEIPEFFPTAWFE